MKEIKTLGSAIQKADRVKVTIIKSLRHNGNTTYREILCSNCNEVSTVQDQTLSRWAKLGKQFCSECNGASKGISDATRVARLNDSRPTIYKGKVEIVKYLGYRQDKRHSFCMVEFKECGHTKEYNCSTLRSLFKQGKALKCDSCDTSNTSNMETWAKDALQGWETQVPYACLATTTRRWVADFYDEDTNTIIEVTTSGQHSKAEYNSNIQEKREWCRNNGIEFIVIEDINKLEDIVRTLGKPKESN